MSPESHTHGPHYYVKHRGDVHAMYMIRLDEPERTVVLFVRVEDASDDRVPTVSTDRLRGVAQQLARKEDAGWARDEHAYSYR